MKLVSIIILLLSTWSVPSDAAEIGKEGIASSAVIRVDLAREKPHVLFVNVHHALPLIRLQSAASAVQADAMVRIAVAESQELGKLNPFDRDFSDKRFSKNAKLIVYVINDPKQASFVSAMGQWAVVNIHGFDAGLPVNEPDRYDRRLRQLMLKGFGLAVGLGMSNNAGCVLYYKSFTPEGIDQAGLGFWFDAHATILNLLADRFGNDIFRSDEDADGAVE